MRVRARAAACSRLDDSSMQWQSAKREHRGQPKMCSLHLAKVPLNYQHMAAGHQYPIAFDSGS